MAQTLLGLDLWFRWHGSSTAQKMTRWAKTLQFSYGSHSITDPRDGRLTFDNRDGRFTPRGKSLVYPREVLTTPTPFFVSLETDVTAMLVSGLAQRVDVQDSTSDECVFTLTAITTRNLEVQPRYAAASGNSITFFDAMAKSLGTSRDPNRTRRPPTGIEGVIEWPPVFQYEVQSATPLFPVQDAVADWTAWSNQPVFVLRDGRIGTAHPSDAENPNTRSISARDLIVSAEPSLRPRHDEAPELINNVIYVGGLQLPPFPDEHDAPQIPIILRVGDVDTNEMTLYWEEAARARGYFPQINGMKFPETPNTYFRFTRVGPDGVALTPATSYLLGVSSVGSVLEDGLFVDAESAADFITGTTSSVPTQDYTPPQPPGLPSNLRVVSVVLDGIFQILWDGPLDTDTTDVATSFDYRWAEQGSNLGAWINTPTSGFSDTTPLSAAETAATIVVQVRSRNDEGPSGAIVGVFDLNDYAEETVACEVPTGLTIGATAVSGTPPTATATARWAAGNNAENSRIEWRTAAAGASLTDSWGSAATITGTATARLTGLTSGQQVQFRVRSFCSTALGSSEWVYSGIITIGAQTLAAPVLTGGTLTRTTFPLTWTHAGTGVGYFEYSIDGGLTWTRVPSSTGSTRAYTVTGLTAGTEYSAVVRAQPANAATHNVSPASNAVAGTTLPPVAPPTAAAPGAIVGLVATAQIGNVLFTWRDPIIDGDNAATGFEWSTTGTGGWQSTSLRSLRVSGPAGSAITRYIRATNAQGAGPASSATATPLATPPPAVASPGTPTATPSTTSTGVRFTLTAAAASTTPPVGATSGFEWSLTGTGLLWSDVPSNGILDVPTPAVRGTGTAVTRYFRAYNFLANGNRQRSGVTAAVTGNGPVDTSPAPTQTPPVPNAVANNAVSQSFTRWTLTAGTAAASGPGSGDTEGYQVSSSGTGGWSDVTDAQSGIAGVQHEVTVTPNRIAPRRTRYFRAYNGVGAARRYSAATSGIASTAQAQVPAALTAPANVREDNKSARNFQFRWDAVTDATHYRYRYVLESARQRNLLALSQATPSAWRTGTLSASITATPATAYRMEVQAGYLVSGRAVVTSPWSRDLTLTTDARDVPPPTNVRLTDVDDDEITARWAAPVERLGGVRVRTYPGIVGYDVEVNGVVRPRTTSTSLKLTGLTANTAYSVRVRTVVVGAQSTWTTAVSATTLLAAPVATGITAGIDNITASVAALPAGATGLRLRGGTIPTASIVADITAPYELRWAGLRSGQRYTNLAVQAFSAANESAWVTLPATSTTDISNTIFALVAPAAATPSAAQMLASANTSIGSNSTSSSVSLTATAFSLRFFVAVPSTWNAAAIVAGTGPSFPLNSLSFYTRLSSFTEAGITFDLYGSSYPSDVSSGSHMENINVFPQGSEFVLLEYTGLLLPVPESVDFSGQFAWLISGYSWRTPVGAGAVGPRVNIGIPAAKRNLTRFTRNGQERVSTLQNQRITKGGVQYKYWTLNNTQGSIERGASYSVSE